MGLRIAIFSVLAAALIGPGLLAQDTGGLQHAVAVDLLGSFPVDDKSSASNQFQPREAELMFFGPVDHLFDGMFSIAAHQEDGMAVGELHEAYISSSKLIPRSRFRLGQFFLGVGRLNQFHRHDWPFTTTPIAHKSFFSEEGVLDSGIEYSLLMPTDMYLDVTVGVTNGFVYGHSHTAGARPRSPTHYGRVATYFEMGALGHQLGFSYLGRTASDGLKTTLAGFDFTSKKREGKTLVFLLQAEGWLRHLKPEAGTKEESFGMYVYPQYGFSPAWQLGIRGDYLSILSLKSAAGKKLANSEVAYWPTLTWKPSEFSTFRLSYGLEERSQKGTKTTRNQVVALQTTVIMGAHPAHEF